MKITIAALCVAFAAAPFTAQAGCLTGAAVGGVAGHMAGHHAGIGAAAGCAVGHHNAVKNKNTAAAQTTAGAGFQQ